MGLGFSHGGAHWAYSGFMRFREKLAFQMGFTLKLMEGFTNTPAAIAWTNEGGELQEFFNHSDCDGHLTPEQCKKMAPLLREAVKDWEGFADSYDKEQALRLVGGMEEAAKANENLEFC